MRILIVGAGALGSYFGGSLKESGNSVTLISRNETHSHAIISDGLNLETNELLKIINIKCITPVEAKDLKPCFNYIFIFTKSKDTLNALESTKFLFNSSTTLVTLQNGIGNEEILSRYSENVIYGCTTLPADILKPGHVISFGSHRTLFCPLSEKSRRSAQTLNVLLNKCGIFSEVSDKIAYEIWRKAIFNSAINVICALTGCTPGEIAKSDDLLKLSKVVATEGSRVAKAIGIEILETDIFDMIEMSITKHPDHKPSMLIDILNEKKTEIESITGKIISSGKKANVQTPFNEVLYTLVKKREKNFCESKDQYYENQ